MTALKRSREVARSHRIDDMPRTAEELHDRVTNPIHESVCRGGRWINPPGPCPIMEAIRAFERRVREEKHGEPPVCDVCGTRYSPAWFPECPSTCTKGEYHPEDDDDGD